MKKFFILKVALFISIALSSQIQDLASLAQGDIVSFNTIRKEQIKDNGLKEYDIWGYYAVYKTDAIDNRNAKYELILLDKNLNKFANKEFDFIKAYTNYGVYFNREKELTLTAEYSFNTEAYHWTIDLKNNTLSKIYKYDDEGQKVYFETFDWEDLKNDNKIAKKERKIKAKELDTKISFTLNPDYYLEYSYLKTQKKGDKVLNKIAYYQTSDSTQLWSHVVNEEINKDIESWNQYWYSYGLEHPDYLFFYTIESLKKAVKVKDSSFKHSFFYSGLIALDKKTGQKVLFTDVLRPYNLHWQSIISSKLIENNQLVFLTLDKTEKGKLNDGYRKLVIDTKTGNLVSDKALSLQDAKSFLEIKKNNKVEKGYELRRRDYMIHDDGSMVIIFEKYKPQKNNVLYVSQSKTTDLVLFNIDKDFNLTDAKSFDKDKSRGYHNDYLFSQYLNNGKSSVYFFQDYKKDEKSWKLGIVKLIGGKINYEEIPISEKEKFTILPYVAKEGYILLREFNEKEKYDQIRLEKLNIN